MRPLLIVIALAGTATLGGCALIAAPIFDEQRNAAVEAQAHADLANARIAAENYAVGNMGAYPTDADGLIDNGYTPSEGMSDVRVLSDGQDICLSVTAESGTIYKLYRDDVFVEGECTNADL
jgi:type II secretory pathway pseudopilin PulG